MRIRVVAILAAVLLAIPAISFLAFLGERVPLALQQVLLVLLLSTYGAYLVAASIRPANRYLRYAYWTWFRLVIRRLFNRPQPTLYERASVGMLGLMVLAAAAFVASVHLA